MGRSNSYATRDDVVHRAALRDPQRAEQFLQRTEQALPHHCLPFVNLAVAGAAAGRFDPTIDFLRNDLSEGDRGLGFIHQGLVCDSICGDPRFVDLFRQTSLPSATTFRRAWRS